MNNHELEKVNRESEVCGGNEAGERSSKNLVLDWQDEERS
jgi:hypothetical protein